MIFRYLKVLRYGSGEVSKENKGPRTSRKVNVGNEITQYLLPIVPLEVYINVLKSFLLPFVRPYPISIVRTPVD